MKITVGIPTKNRYDTLSHTLLSIALQTLAPDEVIIVDDSDRPENLTTIQIYRYIFNLFDERKIKWKVLWGAKKGQHHSHELVQHVAENDLIFRIDDDEIAEPNVLSALSVYFFKAETGAVAPLVLLPHSLSILPEGLTNDIKKLDQPNAQWFKREETVNELSFETAEHLYSCFMYRKNIVHFDSNLSSKAHREETIFTHEIKRAGFDLYIEPNVTVWHFRQETGGIRTDNRVEDYEHDEHIFRGYLSQWGVENVFEEKLVVLDCGIGDHFAFKHILTKLQQKHEKITIAACYPDVFFDTPGLKLISIADAIDLCGSIDKFNIYRRMIDWNWKQSTVKAFEKLYL